MASFLLLVALTGFAAFAALAAVERARFEGRAERFIGFTAVLFAEISVPVLALGHARALRPAPLAVGSFLLSAATIALSTRGLGMRALLRATGRSVREMGRLPWDALRLAVGARSLVVVGLASAFVWIAWTAVLSYYAPSENWDGFFYHEPIVGFAIQNQGFETVALPPAVVVQQVNGFPRLCESVAIWFCIFTDRRLIEIGNSLAIPGLLLATYLLARARSRDAVAAMGWSAAMLWVPAIYSQLRTTLVDIQVGFFLLAAIHFATRPRVGRREALFGTGCLLLLLASKGTALVWAPPVAIVLYFRLFVQTEPGRRRPVFGMAAGSALAMVGVVALTMVPNYLAFHNPLWPVAYRIPALGIAWNGLITMDTMGAVMPLRDLLRAKYHLPTGTIADIISRDYGMGVPWVVAPLFFVASAVLAIQAARARLQKTPDRPAENALLLAFLCVLFAKLPPGISVARYNIHVIALAMAVLAAATEKLRFGVTIQRTLVVSTLALSLVAWGYIGFLGGLDITPSGIAKLLFAPATDRAWMNFAAFQMPRKTARLREQELGPGDLVVFTQDELFIGVLWNDRFDNRVEYMPFDEAESFLTRLEARCAKWALAGKTSGARAALEAHPEEWQSVGVAVRQTGTVMFRRLRPCEPASNPAK